MLLTRPAEARPWMERALRIQVAAQGPDARNSIYMRGMLARIFGEEKVKASSQFSSVVAGLAIKAKM